MSMRVDDNITAIYNAQMMSKSKTDKDIQPKPTVEVEQQNDKSATKTKIGIGLCSAVGIMAALALLSKFDKRGTYSLKPSKIFGGNIKNSYIANAHYKTAQIVTMGAGSILGGLTGGAILDDKKNFNAKLRESLVQICNISFPIATVELLSSLGEFASKKSMPSWCNSNNLFKKAVSKLPPTVGAMTGLAVGMIMGNKVSNNLNEKIFGVKDDRPIKWADLSAHVDDIGVAATFVADEKNPITKFIRRVIPLALIVPGIETGTKKDCH